MPSANCFCNLMDAEEARAAYDLFLTNIGGRYLVSIGSVVAANILEAACDVREATDEDRIAFRAATRARQEAFNRDIPDIQEIPMLMDAFHEDEFWEELGGPLPSCNACANVCPTCYCFDIRDTLDPGAATGRRERVWDACTSPQVRRWPAGTTSGPRRPPACGTACTTSSTAFWPSTTATSAWAAAAAFPPAKSTSAPSRC